jgi:hypothetical protein
LVALQLSTFATVSANSRHSAIPGKPTLLVQGADLFQAAHRELAAMSMTRRSWLGLLASVAAVTVASTPAAAQQTQKPNVVFILADNVGYGDLGPYGGYGFVVAVRDLLRAWRVTACAAARAA